MSRFGILFYIFSLVTSFNINNLVTKINPYNEKKVSSNLFFLENLESNKNFLFLAPKLNKFTSYSGYQNFINELNKYGNVLIGDELNKNDINNYDNITLISHSTAAKESIELSKLDNIKNLVLIDPINIDDNKNTNKIMYDNITDINKINLKEQDCIISNVDNFIYINLKLSNKWRMFPFVVPIGVLKLKLNDIKVDKNINVINKDVNLYGHFDIMDENWSNFFHNSLSKGNPDRNTESLDVLKNWLITTINNIE